MFIKYENGILEVLPHSDTQYVLYEYFHGGCRELQRFKNSIEIQLQPFVLYGLGIEGVSVSLPEYTRLFFIDIPDIDTKYFGNLSDAFDIVRELPYPVKLGVGSNILGLSKAISKGIFEFRKMAFGVFNARQRMAYPKFAVANKTVYHGEELPGLKLEEVEPPTGEVYSIEPQKVSEEPTLPSHFRLVLELEEDELPFPKEFMRCFQDAAPLAAALNTVNTKPLYWYFDYTRQRLMLLGKDWPVVLKCWDLQFEVRGFDIDSEYLYFIIKDGDEFKFAAYDWDLNLQYSYKLKSEDPWGLYILPNQFYVYDANTKKYHVYEARFAYYNYFVSSRELVIYDVFTNASYEKEGSPIEINLSVGTRRVWQSVDELLWMLGYERSASETPALAVFTATTLIRTAAHPETFIEKLFKGVPFDDINPLNVSAAALEIYSVIPDFESAKWGDYFKEIAGLPWTQETFDALNFLVSPQLMENQVFTHSGRAGFTEEGTVTDTEFDVDGYSYLPDDDTKVENLMVPYRAYALSCEYDGSTAYQKIPADRYEVVYEDGNVQTFTSPNLTVVERWYKCGQSIPVRVYQIQGGKRIPLWILHPSQTATAYKDYKTITTFKQVTMRKFKLEEPEYSTPIKGNATVFYDTATKTNKIAVNIIYSEPRRVVLNVYAYAAFPSTYPQQLEYTNFNLTIKAIHQRPSISDDYLTYSDDEVFFETTLTGVGKRNVVIPLEPRYYFVPLTTKLAGIYDSRNIYFQRQLTYNSTTYIVPVYEALEYYDEASNAIYVPAALYSALESNGVQWLIPSRIHITITDNDGFAATKELYIYVLPDPVTMISKQVASIEISGS